MPLNMPAYCIDARLVCFCCCETTIIRCVKCLIVLLSVCDLCFILWCYCTDNFSIDSWSGHISKMYGQRAIRYSCYNLFSLFLYDCNSNISLLVYRSPLYLENAFSMLFLVYFWSRASRELVLYSSGLWGRFAW